MSTEVDQREPPAPKRLGAVVDLIEFAGRLDPSTAVVPGGHRVEDLRLVESARDHGIVDRIILVGDPDRIRSGVSEVGIVVSPEDIVAAADDEQAAAATVELIQAGTADIVLKGDISTPIINRHMLPLAVRSTVSLATVFDAAPIAQGRPIVMTDSGVTTICNFGRMMDLVRNAVDVAHVIGIERPRVAILSANEKPIASLASTRIGLQLAQRDWPDAVVCGPLSFDLATDPGSVRIKGRPDLPGAEEVAGRADVLVCPGIDAANILYKTIAAMNKYGQASLASVTVGFPVPFIILSRADSLETRLVSIALCAVYARQRLALDAPEAGRVATSSPAHRSFRILAVATGAGSMRVAVYEDGRRTQTQEFEAGDWEACTPAEFADDVRRLADLVTREVEQWGCGPLDAIVTSAGLALGSIEDESAAEGRPDDVYRLAEPLDEQGVLNDAVCSGTSDALAESGNENQGGVVAGVLAQRLGVPGFSVAGLPVEALGAEPDGSAGDAVFVGDPTHLRSICEAVRRATGSIGLPAEDANLVVAHVGGATTVVVWRGGKIVFSRMVRVGDDLLGEGRSEDGPAPGQAEAMLDRTAEQIGGAFVAAGCEVDAIVLTSDLINGRRVCAYLRRRVSRLAPVMILDESLDLAVMAAAAGEVLSGRREAKPYPPGK